MIENTIMGQRTTGTDMAFAFVASAGLFGIGDNLIPILNQLRRGGQAVGSMLDNAAKYIDDVLGDIGKQLDTTLDNLAQRIDNLFRNPYAPVLAMEGPPIDVVRQGGSVFDAPMDALNHLDASVVDADVPHPPRYGERRIPDDLYAELRDQTPTPEIRDMVNENIDELIGTPDPAIPGKTIEGRLEADHIVSMDNITRMEGFDQLTYDQQVQVLNCRDNFIGLTKSANASKGSKTYEEWVLYRKENIPINPEFRAKMMAIEKEVEQILQKMIDDFLQ